MTQQIRSTIETGIVLATVMGLVRVLYELGKFPRLAPYLPAAVAILLLYAALLHAWARHEPADYFDRTLGAGLRSLKIFLLVTALVIPVFLVANHFWQQWVVKTAYAPRMIPSLSVVLVNQIFLVALPEEIFFRGWLQNRLNKVFVKKWRCLGVSVGWGWPATAFLFAFAHSLILFQWWHFSIFFPALLFGWLREQTGSINAPTFFHAASNVAAAWIAVSYI